MLGRAERAVVGGVAARVGRAPCGGQKQNSGGEGGTGFHDRFLNGSFCVRKVLSGQLLLTHDAGCRISSSAGF